MNPACFGDLGPTALMGYIPPPVIHPFVRSFSTAAIKPNPPCNGRSTGSHQIAQPLLAHTQLGVGCMQL